MTSHATGAEELIVAHILTWLIAGLIAGGVATHTWERRQLSSDIAALTARQADQLWEAQAKLEELMQQLKDEREQRQALEREVAELRLPSRSGRRARRRSRA